MKTILVTGRNGLIGKKLMAQLTQFEDYNVIGLSKSAHQQANIIHVDFTENWDDSVLPEKVDIIVHLAQSELFRDFPENSQKVFNVNTISTLKLLDYARRSGASKFVLASSGGIYGTGDEEFSEESPIGIKNDLGFYLTTKFCSELIAYNYTNYFSIDILRFFFVYGPGQRQDMLIPRLVNSVKNEIPVVLQGNNGIRLNPIYVEDAVDAIIKCFGLKGNNRINVAGNETFSLRELCETIGLLVKKQPVFKIQDKEPRHIVADISKMKKLLSPPTYSFEEGIKLML